MHLLRTTAAPLFFPLSFLWAVLAHAKRKWSPRTEVSKTLVVGGIHVGGVGKTPVLLSVLECLRHLNPVVLSHGYRSAGAGTGAWMEIGTNDVASYGDEATLLAKHVQVPIYVGKRRVEAIARIRERYPESWVLLDDGFQHLSLKGQVQLVMVPNCPSLENLYCLPFGRLREPLRALQEADAVGIVDPSDQGWEYWNSCLQQVAPHCRLFAFRRRYQGLWSENVALDGEWRGLAFSALGDSQSFAEQVRASGSFFFRNFPDHFHYPEKVLRSLVLERKRRGLNLLITTEKDYVKVYPRLQAMGEKVAFLKMDVALPDAFVNWLLSKVG